MQFPQAAPDDSRLPPPGTIVGGKYRVEGLIGRGGMGAVLAATHRVTSRRVALKWLLHDSLHDAELTQRLVREARAAGRVQHENVVDVYDVGEHQGAMFLVMELLEGQTLADHLSEQGALSCQETLRILLPVMRGVQAAHNNGVIHRDLKPANIFLSRADGTGEIKPRVLDFGVSKIGKGLGDDHSLTQSGTLMGTPYYMAPEQLADEPIDARVDVYALGVILYQCLSGRLPFEANSFGALVTQVATRDPAPLTDVQPELPTPLRALVMQTLSRDRDARVPTVDALHQALSGLQHAAIAASSVPVDPPVREGRAPRGWRGPGIVVGALLLAVGWWLWSNGFEAARRSPELAVETAGRQEMVDPVEIRTASPPETALPSASENEALKVQDAPPAPPVHTEAPAQRSPRRRLRKSGVADAPVDAPPVAATPPTRTQIKVSRDQF